MSGISILRLNTSTPTYKSPTNTKPDSKTSVKNKLLTVASTSSNIGSKAGKPLDVLVATFTNDYNIVSAHGIIVNKLKGEKVYEIPELEKRLTIVEKLITTPQTVIDRKVSLNEISTLKQKIEYIKSGKRLSDYEIKVTKLLEEYRKLGNSNQKISFAETNIANTDHHTLKKLEIITAFLDIAKAYIRIEVNREAKCLDTCQVCGFNLGKLTVEENGLQVCPGCDNERYVTASQGIPIVTDTTQPMTSRSDYDDCENFRKALLRYQGKQPNKLPGNLFERLDEYFSKRTNVPIGETVRALTPTTKGQKVGTSLNLLIAALQAIDCAYLYEDCNLICNIYWGWSPQDLTHLEDQIMSDYMKTQRAYNLIQKDRTSSLGTQYRLFKHLELVGHDCCITDFKVSIMREVLVAHDTLWKKMCELCDEQRIYFIPTI